MDPAESICWCKTCEKGPAKLIPTPEDRLVDLTPGEIRNLKLFKVAYAASDDDEEIMPWFSRMMRYQDAVKVGFYNEG